MAPFAFLSHHSFRRGASNHLTSVPESTAMGVAPSRVGPTAIETPHNKKLRPRSSSLNLLKRSRTPSGNAAVRSSCPASSNIPGCSDTETEYMTTIDYPPESEAATRVPSDSTYSSKSDKSDLDGSDSFSDTSSTGTATRVAPPSFGQDESRGHEYDSEIDGMNTPVPPPPPRTPQILLPAPHTLPEDSPTKYGLRSANTPSPERSLTAAQRGKMTGAGLFVHAANSQKTITSTPPDQARSGAADPELKYSHTSPTLPLPGKSYHSNSLPSRKLRPGRQTPFKEAPMDHVAHALPVKRSQRACFREHDVWHRMGRNQMHPVACCICDGYDTPGDDFMACTWCEMHVCGECYNTFVKSGVTAMMARQTR